MSHLLNTVYPNNQCLLLGIIRTVKLEESILPARNIVLLGSGQLTINSFLTYPALKEFEVLGA